MNRILSIITLFFLVPIALFSQVPQPVDIFDRLNKSSSCNENVNCFSWDIGPNSNNLPISTRNSTVHIRKWENNENPGVDWNTAWGTGTLIRSMDIHDNNVYILTAAHLIYEYDDVTGGGTIPLTLAKGLHLFQVHFNWQRSICNPLSPQGFKDLDPLHFMTRGVSVVASGMPLSDPSITVDDIPIEKDWAILKFNNPIPSHFGYCTAKYDQDEEVFHRLQHSQNNNFSPYNFSAEMDYLVCHHPEGDVKKVHYSSKTGPVLAAQIYQYWYPPNEHSRCASNPNYCGHILQGLFEPDDMGELLGGSSGAGMFSKDGYLVGIVARADASGNKCGIQNSGSMVALCPFFRVLQQIADKVDKAYPNLTITDRCNTIGDLCGFYLQGPAVDINRYVYFVPDKCVGQENCFNGKLDNCEADTDCGCASACANCGDTDWSKPNTGCPPCITATSRDDDDEGGDEGGGFSGYAAAIQFDVDGAVCWPKDGVFPEFALKLNHNSEGISIISPFDNRFKWYKYDDATDTWNTTTDLEIEYVGNIGLQVNEWKVKLTFGANTANPAPVLPPGITLPYTGRYKLHVNQGFNGTTTILPGGVREFYISLFDSPTADAGSDHTLCPGQPAALGGTPAGSGGSGGLSYEWTATTDGADWLSDASAENPSIRPETYDVTYTYTLDVRDCLA